MTKCAGCGSEMQCMIPERMGYVSPNIFGMAKMCERCFRLQNYNEFQYIDIDSSFFSEMYKEINRTNALVVVVTDLFNINSKFDVFLRMNNPKLLVLNKRDILPSNISDEKLLNSIDGNYIDKVLVSSKTNYNFDLLISKIRDYRTSNKVYLLGYTNAGKSSIVNKLLYHYGKKESKIVTSMLPSTTLNMIEMELESGLTLIDTPGIVDKGNISNYVDYEMLNRINPRKVIKPKVYQVRRPQSFIIDNLLQVHVDDKNIVTFYISRDLYIERNFKDKKLNFEKRIINVGDDEDIVVNGLGFINFKKSAVVTIYTFNNVEVYTRKALI